MNIMNCKTWIIDDAERAQSRIDDSSRPPKQNNNQ